MRLSLHQFSGLDRFTRFFISIFVLIIVCETPMRAQAPSEAAIYAPLCTQGPKAVAALSTVLKKPETYSGLILYQASAVALVNKRFEDSGFLFYIAFIRVQYDKVLFSPISQEGEAMATFGMLRAAIGGKLSNALNEDPVTYERVLRRVKAWNPEAPDGYNPGWKYTAKGDSVAALAAIRAKRETYFTGLGGFVTLLKIEAYRVAFRTAQDYMPGARRDGDQAPSKEQFDAAVQTMEKIEQQQNIKGLASKFKGL